VGRAELVGNLRWWRARRNRIDAGHRSLGDGQSGESSR
jgi:hypothetical protein